MEKSYSNSAAVALFKPISILISLHAQCVRHSLRYMQGTCIMHTQASEPMGLASTNKLPNTVWHRCQGCQASNACTLSVLHNSAHQSTTMHSTQSRCNSAKHASIHACCCNPAGGLCRAGRQALHTRRISRGPTPTGPGLQQRCVSKLVGSSAQPADAKRAKPCVHQRSFGTTHPPPPPASKLRSAPLGLLGHGVAADVVDCI